MKVAYWHVKKTAGSAIGLALAQEMRAQGYCYRRFLSSEDLAAEWDDLERYGFIYGHSDAAQLTALVDRGWTSLISLRDPIDRLISDYRYAATISRSQLSRNHLLQNSEMLWPLAFPPHEFFSIRNVNKTYFDNFYVRSLTQNWNLERYMRYPDLLKAQRVLNSFDGVIRLWSLEDDFQGLCQSLFGKSLSLPVVNRTDGQDQQPGRLPAPAMDLFGELRRPLADTQQLDYELLDFVNETSQQRSEALLSVGALERQVTVAVEEGATVVRSEEQLPEGE